MSRKKKMMIVIAATVLIALGGYLIWDHFIKIEYLLPLEVNTVIMDPS